MVPTKRFWLLVALGIPFAVIATLLGATWLAAVYDLLLISAAYVSGRLGPNGSGFQLQRIMDPVLSVRVPNRVTLRLLNEGSELVRGMLRDEPPPGFEASKQEFAIRLYSGAETELTYNITPRQRGDDHFRGTYMRIACPFGLVERQLKLETEQQVRVYPNVLAMREFDFLNQKGKLHELGIRRSRIRGLGSDFESLREYAVGDDYRKIDWKATARRGKLIVRQYEQERNQPVLICIDVGRRMLSEVDGVTKLDYVLDSLLMLTQAAAQANDFVGLLVYSDTVKRYIPPRKGRNQVGMIIEAIHDLVPEPVESDPVVAFSFLASRWKRRSLLVNFTDVEDAREARELTIGMGPLARRHLTVLARISDPRLRELVSGEMETLDDFYLRGSALMFTSERKEAGVVLSSAGMHTLDAEPQELAAALVSFYFEVKERALI